MHVQRIIFSFMVTTSIVCTASANTADIMVIVNDSVVKNIEDDASVFQGIYSGPFEYIDIIKMFNSKGFSF